MSSSLEAAAADAMATGRREAIEAARLGYRGELLPEDPYEDWAFHPRQRVQLRYREVLRLAGRWIELQPSIPPTRRHTSRHARQRLAAADRAGCAASSSCWSGSSTRSLSASAQARRPSRCTDKRPTWISRGPSGSGRRHAPQQLGDASDPLLLDAGRHSAGVRRQW